MSRERERMRKGFIEHIHCTELAHQQTRTFFFFTLCFLFLKKLSFEPILSAAHSGHDHVPLYAVTQGNDVGKGKCKSPPLRLWVGYSYCEQQYRTDIAFAKPLYFLTYTVVGEKHLGLGKALPLPSQPMYPFWDAGCVTGVTSISGAGYFPIQSKGNTEDYENLSLSAPEITKL